MIAIYRVVQGDWGDLSAEEPTKVFPNENPRIAVHAVTISPFEYEGRLVDTAEIIRTLEAERDVLDRAIAALQGNRGRAATAGRRRRRRLSAAARKRISEGMRKRWAARKKAS